MVQQLPQASLELWGGVECTLNRVGDRYFDQIARSGHDRREDDLERIAVLGITTLRYPLLWEHIAPHGPDSAHWSWADRRMERLRGLNLRPIVGLVHHGSGPAHTSLLDPTFPAELAAYAGAVAARYPWAQDYTPINEPLTTARFAALYGHWYPHVRDNHLFALALLNQCKATVLSMSAIRAVTPQARLVQTEDMGAIYGTPHMAYQAEFENHRRWLSFDLLCGRVDRSHALWNYLRDCAIDEATILWFQEHPCPPDIVGVNSYLTSERWLDERVDRFPASAVGGNGRDSYADVAAIHMLPDGIGVPRAAVHAAWERYRLPVAITEAHLGCTREEQLRWLAEAWEAAHRCRAEGADVRAVTVWSLLGAFDWDTLVTRDTSSYEPGAFDVRGPRPRVTALGTLASELAAGQRPSHPTVAGAGWWRRPERFIFGPPDEPPSVLQPGPDARPLLIIGSSGTLGRTFTRLCARRGLAAISLTRADLDIADARAVENYIARLQPWAVINATGYIRVDDAERDPERCVAENTLGAANLAHACARLGARFLTFSSDLVFDGKKGSPYVEDDPVAPLSRYGHSKAAAEQQVFQSLPEALVVRTAALFGPWDDYNFVIGTLQTLAQGERPFAVADEVITPTYGPELVQASLDLLIDGEGGLWHLANQGATSWAEFGRLAAALAGYEPALVNPVSSASLHRPAARPRYSALSSIRGLLLSPLEQALTAFLADSGSPWRAAPLAPTAALDRE